MQKLNNIEKERDEFLNELKTKEIYYKEEIMRYEKEFQSIKENESERYEKEYECHVKTKSKLKEYECKSIFFKINFQIN